ALDQMLAYGWPGNVRELQNCIERAVILTDADAIHARHLNLSFFQAPETPLEEGKRWEPIDLSGSLADACRRAVAEVERRKIAQALEETSGDRQAVARLLQIPHKTLLGKIREHGLS